MRLAWLCWWKQCVHMNAESNFLRYQWVWNALTVCLRDLLIVCFILKFQVACATQTASQRPLCHSNFGHFINRLEILISCSMAQIGHEPKWTCSSGTIATSAAISDPFLCINFCRTSIVSAYSCNRLLQRTIAISVACFHPWRYIAPRLMGSMKLPLGLGAKSSLPIKSKLVFRRYCYRRLLG